MRPPRQFRPLAPVALEDRIALSHLAAAAAHHPAAPAAAGSNTTFPLNIAGTLAADLAVYEQTTTRYADGSTDTGTTLIVPDTTNNTTATTSVVNLRHNGGAETVDEFSYLALTGNTVDVTTTYLPDGSVRTVNQTSQAQGNTTLLAGQIKDSTGISSVSGTTTVRGPVTTTDRTITGPTGQVTRDHTVTVQRGELRKTVTDTEVKPDGTRQVTRTTTTLVRLPIPANLVRSAAAPATAPTLG